MTEMASIQRFGPGEEAGDLSPGDFILAHRHHVLAGLISLAEKRRFRGADAVYAHWSHSAVVESGAHVIEAEAGGIVRSPISKYRDDEYHLVRLDGEIDAAGRERATAYAKSRLGEGFGYLDMLGLAIYLRRRLWLTEKAQRESSLLNTTFRTHLPEPGDPAHGDAILSAMFLVKDMVLYEYSRKFVENPVSWGGRLRHVGNIARRLPLVAGVIMNGAKVLVFVRTAQAVSMEMVELDSLAW